MKNNEYEKDEEKKEVLDLMEENLSLQEVMRLALYMDCLENDAYNIAIVSILNTIKDTGSDYCFEELEDIIFNKRHLLKANTV
jgi:hypothetical protein